MKLLKLLGMALMSVLALATALATSAYALPEFLPSKKAFTSTAGASVLESSTGSKVECKAAAGKGGIETDTVGTFKINFESCTLTVLGIKETCTGSGDAKGIVLSEGSFRFVFDELGTGETLGVGILFLPHETAFECGTFVSNKVKGDVLCLILTPLTSSITHEFRCSGSGKAGEQQCKSYWNDSGTAVTAQLLSSLDGGEFKETNEQVSSTITTSEAGAWMNE